MYVHLLNEKEAPFRFLKGVVMRRGRSSFFFNGSTYHKEKGHLLERERGSYEKGKELSLFNGGTYHKEKEHLLENKRGTC